MDCLQIGLENGGCAFNWDDIEVGDVHLDHSENFFAKKHIKHEKLDELDLIEQLTSTGLDEEKYNPFDRHEFKLEDKENSSPEKSQDNEKMTEKNIESPLNEVKTHVLTEGVPSSDDPSNSGLDVTAPPTNRAPANIACMWSTQKPTASRTKGAVAKNFKAPHAYQFKDLYERKKQDAQKRREEEERKMRQFHSRPVPNFNYYHQQMDNKQVLHVVTMPETPNVLKKSREMNEKRKQKLEELKRQNQPPKIQAREPSVLKEEPFVPKKTQTLIETRPFNLRSERRLQERKQFDMAANRALEEKRKQVQNAEEERKKREEEEFRELRKMATFKARPNPFK